VVEEEDSEMGQHLRVVLAVVVQVWVIRLAVLHLLLVKVLLAATVLMQTELQNLVVAVVVVLQHWGATA
jgi:hypothetical protein